MAAQPKTSVIVESARQTIEIQNITIGRVFRINAQNACQIPSFATDQRSGCLELSLVGPLRGTTPVSLAEIVSERSRGTREQRRPAKQTGFSIGRRHLEFPSGA